MDYIAITEELKEIISPILAEEDIELVELNFVSRRSSSLVRLLVDRRGGGISVGDCARLNQKIGEVLDSSDIIQERYVLEVSSPGLDRPLRTRKDFLRCLNKEVKFFLNKPINGKIELDGVVSRADEEAVIIDIQGQVLEIPLSAVTKAKQVI